MAQALAPSFVSLIQYAPRWIHLHNPQVGVRIMEEVLMETKVFASREWEQFKELVEEVLRDLWKKYEEKRGLLSKRKWLN